MKRLLKTANYQKQGGKKNEQNGEIERMELEIQLRQEEIERIKDDKIKQIK
jgi:hypothetical protein